MSPFSERTNLPQFNVQPTIKSLKSSLVTTGPADRKTSAGNGLCGSDLSGTSNIGNKGPHWSVAVQ